MKFDMLLNSDRYVLYSLSSIMPDSNKTFAERVHVLVIADHPNKLAKTAVQGQILLSLSLHRVRTISPAPYLCKHRILVDGPVLHSSTSLPDDLLVLLEPPVE